MRITTRRLHRWLGLGLGWLMLIWFISGGVMLYAHLPRQHKSAEGRLRHAPALQAEDARQGWGEAWRLAGSPAPLADACLTTVAGRAAYVFTAPGGVRKVVWADDGSVLERAGQEQARRAAALALGRDAPLTYLGLVERDQWTVGTGASAGLGPFHLFAAHDGRGSEIYVSARTGEVAQLTHRAGRFWSWLGAIPHWLYFTALRQHLEVWRWSIIILAALGCLLCLSGLWLGVRYFKAKGWGRGRRRRHSAFLGMRKWHHYLGLVFGLPALGFAFSGMLSLHPFDWCAPDHSPREAAARLAGGPPAPEACRVAPGEALAALAPGFRAKMLRLISFQGRPYLLALDGAGGSRLVTADGGASHVMAALPWEELEAAARGLLPGCRVAWATRLDAGDLYMTRRHGPTLKAVYDDPGETWVYLDPARAGVVALTDGKGRLNRWLYRFLHCLDHPWLLRQEPLRQALLLLLMAGGALLCLTGPWAWLRRRRKRRSP